MKYLLIVAILVLSQNLSFSQNIVVKRKQWEGTRLFPSQKIYNTKFKTSFETINGKEYLELETKIDAGWFQGIQQYYREEDNKVYRLYEGIEKVILDFTLEVGDMIQVSNDDNEKFDFVVKRTADTLIQGIVRRKLEMRGYPVEWTTDNPNKHVWIEGVGDLGFFFGNGEVYGNQVANPIYCVREGIYIYGALSFCPNFDLISKVNDEESENTFRYDYNSKQLLIDNENIIQLDLYSVVGFKIHSYAISNNVNSIDLSTINLPLCVVVIFDGRNYLSKILKL